jgi:hypothetical protein
VLPLDTITTGEVGAAVTAVGEVGAAVTAVGEVGAAVAAVGDVEGDGAQNGSQLMLLRRSVGQSGRHTPPDGIVPLPHSGRLHTDVELVISALICACCSWSAWMSAATSFRRAWISVTGGAVGVEVGLAVGATGAAVGAAEVGPDVGGVVTGAGVAGRHTDGTTGRGMPPDATGGTTQADPAEGRLQQLVAPSSKKDVNGGVIPVAHDVATTAGPVKTPAEVVRVPLFATAVNTSGLPTRSLRPRRNRTPQPHIVSAQTKRHGRQERQAVGSAAWHRRGASRPRRTVRSVERTEQRAVRWCLSASSAARYCASSCVRETRNRQRGQQGET